MEKTARALVEKLGLQPFYPLTGISSGHMQTIAGTYWPQWWEPSQTRLFDFKLSDGDALVIGENTPPGWVSGDRIAVLIHGLTGCYQSTYLIRLSHYFLERGVKVFRMNMRTCGPGMGKSRRIYHCGVSQDPREFITFLKALHPHSPVSLVGFSLGGNVSLKMAGEDGSHPSGNLDSVIAVSPPIDVKSAARLLSSSPNRFFSRYFIRRLIYDLQRQRSFFPDIPKHEEIERPDRLTISLFDQFYTAPLGGFKDSQDYYNKSSSGPLLRHLQVPTLIIGSQDDPVVSGRCFAKIPSTSWIDKVISPQGGHVGFVGWGGKHSWRWADEVLIKWAELNLSKIQKIG